MDPADDELLLPDSREPPKGHRDDLMISLSMARIIMALGFIGALLQPIFGGISLFFVLVQYAILPKLFFLSYYAAIAPSLSLGYFYVCMVSGIINGLYTLWAWIIISKRYAQVMYAVSFVCSVISLALSIVLITPDQMFHAMHYRNQDWFLTLPANTLSDWEGRVFASYQGTDVTRCVFLVLQALAFAPAFYLSRIDFATAMEVEGF
jgi:magnesium-transporting ATPase (P-type)